MGNYGFHIRGPKVKNVPVGPIGFKGIPLNSGTGFKKQFKITSRTQNYGRDLTGALENNIGWTI